MNDYDPHIIDSLLDTLPSGMVFFKDDGSLLRLNQKATQLLGLAADTTVNGLNANWPAYLQPLRQFIQEVTEDVHRGEMNLALPSREEESTIGFTVKTIALPSHTLMKTLIFNDITQILKDQLALERIKDELNQSKKLASIGTMIAGVAHELNNPLTGISMSSSLLKMSTERMLKKYSAEAHPELCESLQKNLNETQKIIRACEKAGILVGDLLSYSKPTQLYLVPLSLQDLVADILNTLKAQPDLSQLDICLEGETPHWVMGDRVKLEQIIYNLVKNASDALSAYEEANPERAGQGRIRLFFTETQNAAQEPMVVLHVMDNGPGIDKTVINRIFDPFFTTKGHSGVGLGLSICYRIAEQHGGRLSVETEKGSWTDFHLSLPVYLESECPIPGLDSGG